MTVFKQTHWLVDDLNPQFRRAVHVTRTGFVIELDKPRISNAVARPRYAWIAAGYALQRAS